MLNPYSSVYNSTREAEMINAFLIFIIIVLSIRGVSTLVFLLQSISWIKKNQFERHKLNLSNKPKVIVLIPALREQKRIINTLNHFVRHFVSKGASIVVITTQREYDTLFNGPSTKEIVEKFIKIGSWENKITCLDYPNSKGVMAHQLNYGLNKITDNNSFVAIYNADSHPHPKTMEIFYNQLNKYPQAKIFQQSSAFIKNFDKFRQSKTLTNIFLQALAILQTRWTFAHEYARLIRQSISGIEFFRKFANAHIVGHGLIIQTKILKEVGGFPTENITEDLFLGYLLRSKGHSIYPLPLLELADSPTTIESTWKQKYVWFWGPMKYWSYFKYVLKNAKTLKITNTTVPLLFTIQGLVSALAWLTSGPIVLICLISPLLTHNSTIALFSYLGIFIYGPLQYLIVYYNFPLFFELGGIRHWQPTLREKMCVTIFSIVAILFHSIPPYFSIVSELKHQITGGVIYKPKTE